MILIGESRNTYSEINASQCPFVHRRLHTDIYGIERGLPCKRTATDSLIHSTAHGKVKQNYILNINQLKRLNPSKHNIFISQMRYTFRTNMAIMRLVTANGLYIYMYIRLVELSSTSIGL
jgi:hypothetical protein